MIYLLRAFALFAVVIFCVFRIAEADWRRTFWPEIIGYWLTGIGGFWEACVFMHLLLLKDEVTSDAWADFVMFLGIAMILWSATCWKLRRSRRAHERCPVQPSLRAVAVDEEDRRAA